MRIIICLVFFLYFLPAAQTVIRVSKKYEDSSRDNRPLLTEIWYPQDEDIEVEKYSSSISGIAKKKYPLVLLSHGTGGNRFSLIWLAKILAEKGFIVAAVDHYGNTTDNRIPEYFVRYWERPLDISFLIDQLLNDSELSNLIDNDKMAVVGFSLGGYTSLALAGAKLDCALLKKKSKTKPGKQELTIPEMGDLAPLVDQIDCSQIPLSLKDSRIKAFVALAPALGLGFSTKDQFTVEAPVLILGAENDMIAPVKRNAAKYHRLIPTSQLQVLKRNLGHYIFLPKVKKYGPDEAIFFEDPQDIDRTEVHKEVGTLILDFLKNSL